MEHIMRAAVHMMIGLVMSVAWINGAQSGDHDFRSSNWGMDYDEVAKREYGLVRDGAFSATAVEIIKMHGASISFFFADNKLGSAQIFLELYGDEVNEAERRRLFQEFFEEYTQRYGEPVEVSNLTDDSNKQAKWVTDRSEISMQIMGIESHFLIIRHTSIDMKDEIEKARDAYNASRE